MTWYEPTYAYFPEDVAAEHGEAASPGGEAPAADDRPAMVYAGPFRPGATALAVPKREPPVLAVRDGPGR
jgi:hypothetical protein